jgi:hypothetical protein
MDENGVGYRPRRIAALVVFLLPLSIASSCSGPNGPGGGVLTPGPSPAPLAGVLGDGKYRELFGVPPREPIGLVDPEIAARSERQR